MARYRKHYKCEDCGHEWDDEWSCLCNDRCPECDTETEVLDYEELPLNPEIKFFSVIYDFDLTSEGYVGGHNPPEKQRRKRFKDPEGDKMRLWELTEGDSEYEYDYMCECDEDDPCTCGWRKGKHRKWCAILTPEQFAEFVEHCGLYATDVGTGGSIGAPGFGFGCAPAIAFDGDCGGDLINVSAYVTPCPEMNGEFWSPEKWEQIQQEVIEHFKT